MMCLLLGSQGEDAGICGPLFYHGMASDVFSDKSGPS